MARPEMIIIAGPPGSGKSTAFPVASWGVDSFNPDDRRAALNQGSYQNIPPLIRAQVGQEMEQFIQDHIRQRKSFAFENALGGEVTFHQTRWAQQEGFVVMMRYVAVDVAATNIERVAIRAEEGGHSAPPERLQAIRAASLRNLPRALRELDEVRVYDNSAFGQAPTLVLHTRAGVPVYLHPEPPAWLAGTSLVG